jgi:hypothetical protein
MKRIHPTIESRGLSANFLVKNLRFWKNGLKSQPSKQAIEANLSTMQFTLM